jgi:hypothetical protein
MDDPATGAGANASGAKSSEELGQPGELARRFDSKKAVKNAKKHGIAFDLTKGGGIPAASPEIEPVDPDTIKDVIGAQNADHYMDISIEGKPVLRRNTKAGHKEIVIRADLRPEDIVASGRTRKRRVSPDDD